MQVLIRRPLVLLGKVLARLCAWTFLFALVAGAALCAWPEEARASYSPVDPTETLSVELILPGGALPLTEVDRVYELLPLADATLQFPSAVGVRGKTITISDTMCYADTYWISLEPAAGERIDVRLAADQHVLLPQACVSVTYVSDGAGWTCVFGCRDSVIDPRSTSPVLWVDAGRGVSTTYAAPDIRVTAWADQSGNGRNLAEVGTSGPALSNCDGRKALGFSGAQYLRSAATYQFTSRTVSLAGLVADQNTGTFNAWFGTDYGSAVGSRGFAGITGGIYNEYLGLLGHWTPGDSFVRYGVPGSSSGPLMYVRGYNRGSSEYVLWLSTCGRVCRGLLNGSATFVDALLSGGDAPHPAITDGYMYVGQSHYNNANHDYWTGLVRMVAVWDAELSAADQARLSAFFMRRGGLQ